jgi:hypothetical protein
MMEEAPNAEEAWNAYRKRIRTRSEKARISIRQAINIICEITIEKECKSIGN